jgi:conjugative relaxase-like TrwC/TraI family protein
VKEVVGYFIELKTPEAYYFDSQEFTGFWVGKTASRLGLNGKVDARSFERLCANLHPRTGEPLTPITRDGRRIAQDHTFSAPKSWSLGYAYTGDERFIEGLRYAGAKAIEALEELMATRVRKNGQDFDRPTGNLVASEHIHLTSRPVDGFPDPNVHVHYVIFNVTWDPVEKQFKAAQMGDVLDHTVFLDKIFLTALAEFGKKMGLQIEPTEHAFEIEGFHRGLIEKFSRRTKEIEETAARLGITDPVMKAKLGAMTRERKARSLSMPELKEYWFDGLTEEEKKPFKALVERLRHSQAEDLSEKIVLAPEAAATVSPEEEKTSDLLGKGKQAKDDGRRKRESINTRTKPRTPQDETATVVTMHDRRAVELAIKHIFQRQSVATENQLLTQAFNEWSVGRATWQGVKQVIAETPLLRKKIGNKTFVTTKEVLDEENRVIERCLNGKWKFEPMNPNWKIQDQKLNDQQRNAVMHVVTSRDRVVGIAGLAGTGKTTLLEELRASLEQRFVHILALAPSAEASRERLREVGFSNAETVAQLFASKELQTAGRGAVWLVDEAGPLSTKDADRLLALAEQLDARVVFIGDTGQHRPVERGQAFDLLEKFAHLSVARVDEIQRQKGLYKSFVKRVVAKDIEGAFDILQEMGAVKEMSIEERQVALAKDYVDAIERKKTALVVAPTHKECENVVVGIRELLKQKGRLKHAAEWNTLSDLAWTDAQKEFYNSYEKGQVVQFNRHVKGFKLGERVEVVDVREDVVRVRRKLPLRDQICPLPLHEAESFNVYEKEKLEICEGEKIRITLNSRTADRHRVDNGNEYEIDYIDHKGQLVLNNGWRLDKTFPHMEYAYPLTSHSSQSRSVDCVYLAQTAKFSAPAMDLAQFYVSSTRARSEIKMYVDSIPLVKELVSRVRERPMATELFCKDNGKGALVPDSNEPITHSSATLGEASAIKVAMVAEMERLRRKKLEAENRKTMAMAL